MHRMTARDFRLVTICSVRFTNLTGLTNSNDRLRTPNDTMNKRHSCACAGSTTVVNQVSCCNVGRPLRWRFDMVREGARASIVEVGMCIRAQRSPSVSCTFSLKARRMMPKQQRARADRIEVLKGR